MHTLMKFRIKKKKLFQSDNILIKIFIYLWIQNEGLGKDCIKKQMIAENEGLKAETEGLILTAQYQSLPKFWY